MLSSGILPRLLKPALSHRMSGRAFIWSTIGICIILLFFSLLYSELIINKPAFTLALISAAMFSFYCVVLTARYESLLRSLLTPFIFVLIFILFYVFNINILKILDLYTYFSSGISLALFFSITLIATHFVAGYIVRAQKSTNVLVKNTLKFTAMLIMTFTLLASYSVMYLMPINSNDAPYNFIAYAPTTGELETFLLLIIALPPINALLDWLSLALSRYCFDKVLLHSRWTQWIYITLDLIGAIVTLVLLYTLIFWVLGRFELLFPNSVGDVAAMRELWWQSPWHPDVLWITIMGATTMIMTLLHILTSLWGLFFWLPQDLRQRRRYARQLAAEAKRVPILPGEKYPASELHHQIAHFLTIGRDRTIVWGFCIGGAMLSWIINLFYPHIPFLSV